MPVRGATLAVHERGASADPALLLIAAATWSRDWWPEELCARLAAAGLRVVRYDARDTGESTAYPPGEPGYTAADLVADAVAVLDALDIGRAFVLGLSMGGGAAQALAARHPDRVAGLVLVSTSPAGPTGRDLPPPTPEILRALTGAPAEPDWSDRDAVVEWVVRTERPYAGPGSFDEPALRELAGRVWDRTPTMAAAATNHALVAASGDTVDVAALAGVPAVVVHGSADPLFPLEHGRVLAEVLGAPLVVLDGVGHQAPPPRTWPVLLEQVAVLTGPDRARRAGER